jgi:hypothetical protein
MFKTGTFSGDLSQLSTILQKKSLGNLNLFGQKLLGVLRLELFWAI